ncbi:EexN family lipoprotein [Bartonella machadoae]|uniref:EexN family lipoprotein n=1 Tax=Bartonella machadoae TaxID=2893471 RepID=UPI001F4D271F|nr:EexN family lipoprotein [Bartonella machadoae]UNE53880.1 EexN family lipoprotein [Bartonella machadoae]
MKKTLITALLLGTGIIAAGCKKTYSVEEFKKDKNLRDEWLRKCGWSGTSQNCKNLTDAAIELQKESIQELKNEYRKKYRNNDDEQKAKEQ